MEDGHNKELLLEILGRYKEKGYTELIAIRSIYEKIAEEHPIRFAEEIEGKVSVKEHLNLIRVALLNRSSLENVNINCIPAAIAGKGA